MEVEEIQTQGSKFPRIGNCDFGDQNEENENRRTGHGIINTSSALGRFCGWPASRIVRVSRASGGKDRHSKVWTSKGLRDRRVRLSVHTAIQFYDLQDRLGYDQPSKAVEWLLKAAARSIDDLPTINTSFPDHPDPPKGGSGEVEIDTDPTESTQPVSSNSETSKGSGGVLSLSRSENRVKARERAKERRAEREKEKETNNVVPSHHHLLPSSQSSFTELLTTGEEGARQWGSASPLDYFSMAQYHSQIQNQNQNHEMQQFSLLNSDHMNNAAAATDLGFTMSSSSSGNMNRGTLQSNSQQHSMLLPHHHHHHHPYGSGVPFFVGTAATHTAENHHHHNLHHHHQQLQFYGDENGRHLDHKGKGKN